jgi:hypothetical protein
MSDVRVTMARQKLSSASHHLVILLRMSRTCVTSAVNVLPPVTGRPAEHIPGRESPQRPNESLSVVAIRVVKGIADA